MDGCSVWGRGLVARPRGRAQRAVMDRNSWTVAVTSCASRRSTCRRMMTPSANDRAGARGRAGRGIDSEEDSNAP